MRQRTALALLAALAGALALWWLFATYDRSAHLGQLHLSRPAAIRKARSVARLNGINPSGWPASVRITNARGGAWIYLWRHLHPQPSVFSSLVSPFVIDVTLRQPDGQRYAAVTFDLDGRPIGFSNETRVTPELEHVHPSETLDAQAEGVLADYLGDQARLFHPVNRGVMQSYKTLYSWEYSDPKDSPHLLRFEASFVEQRLVHAELIAEPSDSFRAEVRRFQSPQGYLAAVMVGTVFVLLTLAFPAFFRALVRGRLRYRRLASALAVGLTFSGIILFGGGWFDQSRASAAREFSSSFDNFAGQLIAMATLGLALMFFYSAGRALVRPAGYLHWYPLEALLDRDFNQRLIGASMLHGVLCGVGLAALPYLLAPFVLPAQGAAASVSALYFPSPAASFLAPTALVDVACIVLFLIPLVRWIRFGVLLYAAAATVIWFILHSPFDDWIWPGIAASLLCVVGLWLVESEFGALAAIIAGAAMVATGTAAAFWVQPIATLTHQGWWIAAPFVAMAIGGLVLMRFGNAIEPASAVAAMQAESSVEMQSQRERLTTEFDVARRAQQAMLPPVPAQLGVASLAASCIPARDVGGDLYDFYATGDGRYAIGVADVSGKGVPASLYMTLTKGFLAAAGRDSDDLLATLSLLNSHLYAAGKRKIFVTMALTFFSPDQRRIQLARAGHNSPLWRRASLGHSEYLTPPGMGLGLTSRLLFERALRLQQIDLAPGDAFILYSDGITEAMNEDHEQFGEDRLQAVVDGCDGKSAQATEQAILLAVRAFIGAAPPHDDMTLFVVRV